MGGVEPLNSAAFAAVMAVVSVHEPARVAQALGAGDAPAFPRTGERRQDDQRGILHDSGGLAAEVKRTSVRETRETEGSVHRAHHGS